MHNIFPPMTVPYSCPSLPSMVQNSAVTSLDTSQNTFMYYMYSYPMVAGADLGLLQWWGCSSSAKNLGHAHLIKTTPIFY